MNLGPHADFIVAAYAVTIFVVAALVAWIALDYSALQRILGDLEARGITRRSLQYIRDHSNFLGLERSAHVSARCLSPQTRFSGSEAIGSPTGGPSSCEGRIGRRQGFRDVADPGIACRKHR